LRDFEYNRKESASTGKRESRTVAEYVCKNIQGSKPMCQLLFIAALFLIVLLAVNIEYLIFPSLLASGAGIISVLLGLGIILYGGLRKRKTESEPSGSSGTDEAHRSAGCAPLVAGGLFFLTGIGVLVLQAIGYLHSLELTK
jgi:hypothetical protein